MNEKKLLEALEGMIENRWTMANNTTGDTRKRHTTQAVELEGVRRMLLDPECLDRIWNLYKKEEA